MSLSFDVYGIPTPQGSKTRMPNGAMVEGRSTNQRRMSADWRTAVATTAAQHVGEHGQFDGPLALVVSFRFPMPAARPKAVRARGYAWKTSAPDLDKLIRAVGDALTISGLIRDDARFCNISATKTEVVGWTGATITITEGEPI